MGRDLPGLFPVRRTMKITIWGINYAPEPTGIGPYNTDLCEYLRGRGHEVNMLTGFAYYPAWRKAAEDRGRLFRREIRAGVAVCRCWQYVPSQPNAWKRILHEMTFIVSSFCRLLVMRRPDLLLVVSPPLFLGPAAWVAGLIKRCPFQFHVQDMQPDAALALGLLKPGPLTRFLHRVERFTCKRAGVVSGITRGMLQLFTRKGVPAEKQYLLPNWIICRQQESGAAETPPVSFRAAHAIDPEDFLVVYSGNLGKKQGLEIILDAARQMDQRPPNPKVNFVIAGQGAAAEGLRRRVEAEKLPVRLLPLQPEPLFQSMLQEADLCLVTQQKGSGALFFPSKLITLLSAGCPVITVADADSELAAAAEEANFGRNVLPDDPGQLAAAILDFARNRERMSPLAAAGSQWVSQFSRESILGKFVDFVERNFSPRIKGAITTFAHEQK